MKKSKEFYKLLEKEGLFDFYSNVDDNFIDEKFEAINYLLQVLDLIEEDIDYHKDIKKNVSS